ncbi:TRAP transporter small permease, partial [Thermodesulfobacteriota bacterium]
RREENYGTRSWGFLILVLMFIFVADVVGRYFFNAPIVWAFEITEGLMAIGICLGISFAELEEGHVRVKVLFELLPKSTKRHLDKFTYFVAIIMTSLYTWQTTLFAIENKGHGLHTDILEIPMIVFHSFLPVGFGLWTIVLFIKLIGAFMGEEQRIVHQID